MHVFMRKALPGLLLAWFLCFLISFILGVQRQIQLAKEQSSREGQANLALLEAQLAASHWQVYESLADLNTQTELVLAAASDEFDSVLLLAESSLSSLNNFIAIAVFDAEWDLQASSASFPDKDLSSLLRSRKEELGVSSYLLGLEGGGVFRLQLMSLGGKSRPAGFLAILSSFDMSKNISWTSNGLQSSQEKLQDFREQIGKADFSRLASDGIISIASLRNNQAILLKSRASTIRGSSFFSVLFWSVMYSLPGLVLCIYWLYKTKNEVFLPLDKLFLLVKMLAANNRFQKKPSFQEHPYFRRLANEVTRHTSQLESQKRNWQKKYNEIKSMQEYFQDLGKLTSNETDLWLSETTKLVKVVLELVDELVLRSKQDRQACVEVLHEIGIELMRLNSYQIGFEISSLSKTVKPTLARYAKLAEKGSQCSLEELEQFEELLYELAAKFHGYEKARQEVFPVESMPARAGKDAFRQRLAYWNNCGLDLSIEQTAFTSIKQLFEDPSFAIRTINDCLGPLVWAWDYLHRKRTTIAQWKIKVEDGSLSARSVRVSLDLRGSLRVNVALKPIDKQCLPDFITLAVERSLEGLREALASYDLAVRFKWFEQGLVSIEVAHVSHRELLLSHG